MQYNDIYKIALSLIPKVGPILARRLVSYVGSVEGIFTEKNSILAKIPGVGDAVSKVIKTSEILDNAEKELQIIEKQNYKYKFYLDKDYPYRLKECEDAPIVMYYNGEDCFNQTKIISIVGTRKSTSYGNDLCEKFISDLSVDFPELIIASGFAYGIDICAHKMAMERNLKTIAVFGHDLTMVYPAQHKKYVKGVLQNGAFVSEFGTMKKKDAGNFVSRNRIIAGLADATIVIESAEKGGALITADVASSYNRDVFAFPGRTSDTYSKGCNNLIKQNKAGLIESAKDFTLAMRWDVESIKKPIQKQLFPDLSDMEQTIYSAVKDYDSISLDELSNKLQKSLSIVSSTLLNLEFKGLIKSLPGKTYKIF